MTKFNNTETIAIDSNILTYFVAATTHGYLPDLKNDDPKTVQLEKEHVTSFQIPMYSKWYAILPAVRTEYLKIKEDNKLSFHIYADQIFIDYDYAYLDRKVINKRAEEFNEIHTGTKKYNDCLIAAEAEAIKDTTILLSNDFTFIEKINPIVNDLIIMKPTDFKSRFNLKNESLKTSPSESNYLSKETWWRL